MDIRVLNYFITIVQTKSITNAAEALHITQPTLSRQIKDLEEELDTVLFHRGSREIQLTSDDQYLYNRAVDIVSLVDKTQNNFRRTQDIAGDLYIGAAESQSLNIVSQAIAKLTQTYPQTRVHLQSGNADNILEQLNQGVHDFSITFGSYSNQKYDSLPLPNQDYWGLLVPRNHPLTRLEQITLKDAVAYPPHCLSSDQR